MCLKTRAARCPIVLLFYFLVGGRVYCAWVCPVNVVTDTAGWLAAPPSWHQGQCAPVARDPLLGAGDDAGRFGGDWRGAVGTDQSGLDAASRPDLRHGDLAWAIVLAIFLFDLFVMSRGWCGRLCPVGAFYGLIGRWVRCAFLPRPVPPATIAWIASRSVPSRRSSGRHSRALRRAPDR